jgi:hypothetical protein
MIKHLVSGALVLTLGAVGLAPEARGKPPVFRGSATWTVDPPSPCGAFSSLLVQSTQADANVIEVVYQAGNTCDGSFAIVQATGTGVVTGNINRLRIEALIATSDERPVDIDLTLNRTRDLSDEKVVSARATGTVLLDGVDLTGGVPATSATITRSKS